jgi:seryl-tRNA synthetase
MLALPEHISQIEHKVQLLVQKMKLLKRENAEMLEMIIEFKQQTEQYQKNLANLEAQLNKAKSAIKDDSTAKQLDSKKVKEEIEDYIKEIDKCLEWLQSV